MERKSKEEEKKGRKAWAPGGINNDISVCVRSFIPLPPGISPCCPSPVVRGSEFREAPTTPPTSVEK